MSVIVLAILVAAASNQTAGRDSVFDPATQQQLIELRRAFDQAELAAIREFDRALGAAQARIAIPRDNYERQLATKAAGQYHWTPEQRRRAAAAWPARRQKLDEAEAALSQRTVAILKRFGYQEDALPRIRRRKWDGPAVYAFMPAASLSPRSLALLREVRRLWTISGRPDSSVR
jgi:hypothetical protein